MSKNSYLKFDRHRGQNDGQRARVFVRVIESACTPDSVCESEREEERFDF